MSERGEIEREAVETIERASEGAGARSSSRSPRPRSTRLGIARRGAS